MIRQLRVYELAVPMRRPFDHASHARAVAESVLVRVDVDDATGWGEGAPRRYVTGESTAGAMAAFARFDPTLLDVLVDWSSWRSVAKSLLAIDLPRLLGGPIAAPARAAALEIGLVDAICRAEGWPLSDALLAAGLNADDPRAAAEVGPRILRPEPEETPVALVIDLSRTSHDVLSTLSPSGLTHLQHVKLKAPTDPDEAQQRVRETNAALPADVTVSVDANGAWPADDAVRLAPQLVELGVDWVEEPTTPRDWATLRTIRQSGLGVMLDESFVDDTDLRHAVFADAATHLNIRVSKCGGVLRAARYAAMARRLEVDWQIGCHVGELGPLWAAARTLATTLVGARTYEAGRQDEWFDPNLTEPAYSVDRERWRAQPLEGPGTGVVPTPDLLRQARSTLHWDRASANWRTTG